MPQRTVFHNRKPPMISALVAGFLLAGSAPAARNIRPSQPVASPVPVILISIDTLRADHLSCYGYRHLKTPAIDALAADGTLFSQASSQIPITLPSHLSLFTSTSPFANGIGENGERVPQGAVTLAGILQSHGYSTAAFIGGYFLAREFGLDQGFSFYDSPFSGHMEGSEAAAALKRPAADVLAEARKWLEARGVKISMRSRPRAPSLASAARIVPRFCFGTPRVSAQ